MEILLPQFMAVVMGIFLSPALPEDMIKVGDPCEQAMAVMHAQGLTLVDKEFLSDRGPIFELGQLQVSLARSLGVLSLSYDRTAFSRVANAAFPDRTKGGFLLCGLALKEDPKTEK